MACKWTFQCARPESVHEMNDGLSEMIGVMIHDIQGIIMVRFRDDFAILVKNRWDLTTVIKAIMEFTFHK